MGLKFNVFTGNFDQTGSGGGGGSSYIDGEVQNFSALPQTVGSPAVDSAYLVREAEGTWLLNRKPAGIYIRTANTGTRASDWTYAGEFPDVFSDANFVLYDNGDSTKNLQFQLSAIATGTTRTISVPDANITLDDAGDSRTPTAHAASHAAGVKAQYIGQVEGMSNNVLIRANTAGTAGNSIVLAFDGVDGIATVLAAWNSANPSNQATLVSGDDSQVPNNGETITLSGGVAAGSDPAFDQNLNTSNSPTFNKLTITPDQNDSSLKLGTLEFQSYALNNAWIGDNVYFDGTDFKRRNTGAATLFYFQGNEGQFRCDVSGNAGTTVTSDPAFKVGAGGKFSAGANVSNAGEFEAGMIFSDGNNIGFSDKTDNSKKATLDLSGITSGETRSLEIPDASGTLALTSDIPALGTGAGEAAEGNHAHGNLTSDGKIGSTAGLPVVTTTAGAVTTLALGTANQVLRVNSGATGVEFADPAAAGVTSVTGTAPIVSSGGTTPTISVTVGATANTVAAGDDSRITGAAQKSANLSDLASASTARTNLGLGTAATAATGDFAAASHSHELTSLAATGAANGTILTANGSGGVTFAAASGGGVTGAAASASDVLGVSGANITGVDANADRIVYWNNTSNKLAYGTPADAGAAAASHTHAASDITSGTINTARLASGAANSGTFLRGDQTWAAAGGVTTGSVDNAILRADGTEGSTSQSSDLVIDDAITTTQNNVAIRNNHSLTDSALVLTPKGTGAFIVGPKPDGTSTGGNARGTNSIDIQLTRANANQVASGNSCVVIGTSSRASSNEAVVIGVGATSTAIRSVALGFNATANGGASVSIGELSNSGGTHSVALGRITDANLRGMLSTVPFNSVYWGGQTTNNAATILNLDATATNRFTIAANTALAVDILLVARRSDVADKWLVARRFLGIRRDGSNNTSLIGAVQTLGTDQSAGSPTWSFTLTADDTNEALQLEVTGATSETVQWRATAIYRVV